MLSYTWNFAHPDPAFNLTSVVSFTLTLSFHCFTNYIKVTFFQGASLRPAPLGKSKYPRVRYLDIREGEFDETQFADWVKQASQLPGERM